MKLTKKSIFSIVYWGISCLILIISNVVSFVQDRNPPDDIFLPGSSIDLFFPLWLLPYNCFYIFCCLRARAIGSSPKIKPFWVCCA